MKRLSDTDFPVMEDRHDTGNRVSLVVVIGVLVFICLCLVPAAAIIITSL